MIIPEILEELRKYEVEIKLRENNIILSGAKDKVPKELLNEIRSKKSQILDYLNSDKEYHVKTDTYHPLTAQQRSIWLASGRSETSLLYNQASMFLIEGALNYDALEYAINKLISEQESLRTGIHEINGELFQRVYPAIEYQLETFDCAEEHDIIRSFKQFSNFIFDLRNPPLLRVRVLKQEDSKHYLFINIHHIISDGWSVNIFLEELFSSYVNFLKGKRKSDDVRVFSEYAEQQVELVKSESGKKYLEFWKEKITDTFKPTSIASKTDVNTPYYKGDYRNFHLSKEYSQNITDYCRNKKITAFNFYAAVITVLLKKFTGDKVISFGTPFACRTEERYNDVIGCFINTLPVIVDTSESETFDDIILAVQKEITEVFRRQSYPAESIIDNLGVNVAKDGSPLFDVIITHQNYSLSQLEYDNLKIRFIEAPIEKCKSGLVLRIFDEEDSTIINIEYSRKLFDESFIDQLFSHIENVIRQVLKNDKTLIGNVEYINASQKRDLISSLDNSEVQYDNSLTIVDKFKRIVEKYGDSVAVTYGDASYTYKSIDQKSDVIANYLLHTCDISQNEIIGVSTDRDQNLIISILGILKAGAVYLPVNPDYPDARKKLILADTGCKAVLCEREYNEDGVKYISVRMLLESEQYSDSLKYLDSAITQSDPSYIIYTSGSTGTPKGVVVTHKNLYRLFFNDTSLFDFNEHDVWSLFHSFSFDFSVWEIFGALLFGGRLVIVRDEVIQDPEAYLSLLKEEKVTILNQTPSSFHRLQISDEENLALRYIIFGGELLHPAKLANWKKMFPDTKVINMYGITETTVHVTYKEISEDDIEAGISNIGKPIPTLGVCILDKDLRILPPGIPGQICVYGEGLSDGYLNRSKLTDEKFKTIDPFGRCYLSGDLGRLLNSGDIEYLGRMDNQIQLHGHRVEIGEVEKALSNIEGVVNSVVIVRDNDSDVTLSAFVVRSGELSIEMIRKELSYKIPAYMIPARIVFVENIPLTINGKVDRNKLLELNSSGSRRLIYPRTRTETIISEIWKSILGIDELSIDDSFFVVGGDSIKVLKIAKEISAKLNYELKVAEIYEYDTIESLSEYLLKAEISKEPKYKDELNQIRKNSNELIRKFHLEERLEHILPMSDIQKGMVFYSLKNPETSVYHDQFVYQVNIRNISEDVFKQALSMMISKHPILRTAFNMFDYNEDMQLVYKAIEYTVPIDDISEMSSSEIESEINKYLEEQRYKPFDLQEPPLWRIKLFLLPQDMVAICWSFHHSLLDGWSNASFITELLSVYRELLNNINYSCGDLKSDYSNYLAEQNIARSDQEVLEFWKNELQDYKRIELPREGNSAGSEGVAEILIEFNDNLRSELINTASKLKTDLKTILLSAYLYSINMITFEDEVLVGIVTNNRPVTDDAEKILGCFLNTVPFRMKIEDEVSWKDFIELVVKQTQKIKKYESLSLYEIIKNIGIHAGETNPLFDVVYNFVDFSIYENVSKEYLPIESMKEYKLSGYENTNTPLNFTLSNTFDKLSLKVTYSSSAISSDWVQRITAYFTKNVYTLAENVNQRINSHQILSEEELQTLESINKNKADFNLNTTYIEELCRSFDLYKDNTAVVYENESITYKELDNKSEIVAHMISGLANPGSAVVLISKPSIDFYVGMISILKAGCTVLPVSLKTPPERIKKVIRDSNAEIVLSDKLSLKTVNLLPEEFEKNITRTILLDDVSNLADSTVNRYHRVFHPDDPVYIVYTSGTTGTPKGILYNNRSVLNLCNWYNEYYQITSNDRTTKYAEINYDANVWEIFPALLRGATIYNIPYEVKLDMSGLNQFYQDNIITVSWLPTPILEQFITEENSSLRILTTGGDRLKNVIAKPYRIFNNYGPAENTVCASVYEVCSNEKNIPIGKPIANNEIYILKRNSAELLPPGIAGEICITGDSLAVGYLNDTYLTDAKYAKHFSGERIYRTGDLGRLNEDGEIEFLGRIDRQIKINGQRLEVEEIESLLLQHTGIREAVVTTDENQTVKNLLAFVVQKKSELSAQGIKEYLGKSIPGYMIPGEIYFISKIPLTATGKINYNELLKYAVVESKESIYSLNDTEKTLAGIWSDVLNKNIDSIDNKKNFFEQGGDSISLIRIQRKVNDIFNADIPITDLLNHTSLRKLANHINRIKGGQVSQGESEIDEDPKEVRLQNEDIAVIGMSCRFPGADNINEFWNNLVRGVESITFFSDNELRENGIPEELIKDGAYTKAAGIISNPDTFDPAFFGYTDDEARIMDPQIRVFHECCWSALEDAGYDPDTYTERIGVFAGASRNSIWERSAFNTENVDAFSSSLLSNKDNLATLISYKLNLRGPAVNLYTACSTSLVAVHEACKSLSAGECEMAICGGVNLSLPIVGGSISGEGSVFSEDGHCRPFSLDGSGTIAGKGTGIVLLKPVSKAIEDNDNIYAVIKSTAINNDGYRKVGYTAPSAAGQSELLSSIYNENGIDPTSIDYIETHGTGTELGDAVELDALNTIFANVDRKIALGSVKSNIGHTDTAAGIASFIKTVLMLRNKYFVPSLHSPITNTNVSKDRNSFYIMDKTVEWKKDNYNRRAGVSSFGIGGTNAHIVLEEYNQPKVQTSSDNYSIIPFSAKTSNSLTNYKNVFSEYVKNHSDLTLSDIAFTLQNGRSDFRYRESIVCKDIKDLLKRLQVHNQPDKASDTNNVVFMFPGQGTQYVNMGRDLYDSFAEFRKWFDRCDDILRIHLPQVSIKSIIYPDDPSVEKSEISETVAAHCSLFIFEYSLAKLMLSLGIRPDVMVGHSLGEYVAACISGILTLEDALALVVARGKAAKEVHGKMLSVLSSENEIYNLIDRFNGGDNKVYLAAINSDVHFIISGDSDSITEFSAFLSESEIENRILHIDFASHCNLMNKVIDKFSLELAAIKHNATKIPVVTNYHSQLITKNDELEKTYWSDHLLNPIEFASGLSKAVDEDKDNILIEIGPGSTLSSFAKNINAINDQTRIISFIPHPKEDEIFERYFKSRIASCWNAGLKINWQGFGESIKGNRVSLPTYQFEHTKYPFLRSEIYQSNNARVNQPQSWYYVPGWKQTRLPRISKLRNKRIVVFTDAGQLANDIELNVDGNELVVVKSGDVFKKVTNQFYEINVGNFEDYSKLFSSLKNDSFVASNIIHLLGLSDKYDSSYANVLESQYSGFLSLLNIAKAANKNSYSELTITKVCSHISSITGAEKMFPAKSTILAALNIIQQEYYGYKVHCIEIDNDYSGSIERGLFLKLLNEIHALESGSVKDKHIVYRNNKRWIQSYDSIERSIDTEQFSRFRREGAYIITGGAGNVGNVFAQFLSHNYSAKVIIVGKTQLPARDKRDENEALGEYQQKLIKNIIKCEKLGAEVNYFHADVGDKDAMDEIFKTAIERYGKIDGIIHAAAATKESSISTPLQDTTIAELAEQFSVKVKGLYVISELLEKYKADIVIVTSSVSSILGGIGFGAYAASNVIVNTFVQKMNRENRTEWISLILDGWYFPEYSNELSDTPRATLINEEDGLNILKEIQNLDDIENLVITKRNLVKEITTWTESLYQEPKETKRKTGKEKDRPFLTTSYLPPENEIEKTLCEIWEEFFGIKNIGIDDHFYELGGDSLKATTIVSLIHKKLGIRIPLTQFLRKPTIRKTSSFIAASNAEEYYEIIPAKELECYPLSSAQKRLFMLYRLEKNSLAYNVHSSALLIGKLDIAKLTNALGELIKRHESLRTIFYLKNGKPVQQVLSSDSISIVIESVKDETDFFRPFDLEEAPLIRAGIKSLGASKNVLLLDTHHIISDAISMSICFKELSSLYEGELLSKLSLQYKDYATWQYNSLEEHFIKKQKEFWLECLSGELPVLNMPLDYNRPAVQKYDGDAIVSTIESRELKELKRVAQDNDSTLFMVLLAAFNILLAKYSDQDDIVLGTPSAGRRNDELSNVIGMFANTIVLRNKPAGNITFTDFMKDVKENSLKAFENQDYQFEELVEDLKVERDVSRNPIFDVMFVYINVDFSSGGMKGIDIKPYPLNNKISRFDLSLHCNEENSSIELTFEYSTALFKKRTIERLSAHFKRVLNIVIENPDSLLEDISLIDETEVKTLKSFNPVRNDVISEPLTVTSYYRKVFSPNRQMPAMLFSEEGCDEISYADYKESVDKISAAILGNIDYKQGGLIGVVSDRNEYMIYCTMAVLNSCNGYVPIDPDGPSERARYVVEDSNCSIVLCESKHLDYVKDIFNKSILVVDEILKEDSSPEVVNYPDIYGESPLFLLYTSGSTGKPKGVLMPHKSIMNLLLWMRQEYPVESERILFLNPYTFDMSIWGLYAWVVNGSSVCVLKHGDEKDPSKILDAVLNHSVTTIHFVPSMLAVFLEYIEKNNPELRGIKLRYIFVSGEILQKHLIEKFNKCFEGTHAELINFYGPTETHVVTHFRTKELDDEIHKIVPIGKPISNTKVLVVDKSLKLVPQGVTGELLLGGNCLADCYLNKEDITKEKFVNVNNELTDGTERFYRTGDLGRWLSDGNLEFLGRNDFQIKIRGFRVEPGEIQSAINAIQGVKESLVVVKNQTDGDKRLAVYVVFEKGKERDDVFIRGELKKQIADYMIPSFIVPLDKFPLNPNGKVDRNKLPEPAQIRNSKDIITPRNKLEKKVADIWSNVLNIEKISISDNFFDLGGHSLLVIRVHAELENVIDNKIEVVDLFRYPTIASLADFINKKGTDDEIIDKAAARAEKQKNARERRKDNIKRNRNKDE